MTAFSTPESRAALETLKDIVRENIPADKVDAHAMRLLGESDDMIDGEARALCEALQRQPSEFPRNQAVALTYALREVIFDRVREIRNNAT